MWHARSAQKCPNRSSKRPGKYFSLQKAGDPLGGLVRVTLVRDDGPGLAFEVALLGQSLVGLHVVRDDGERDVT